MYKVLTIAVLGLLAGACSGDKSNTKEGAKAVKSTVYKEDFSKAKYANFGEEVDMASEKIHTMEAFNSLTKGKESVDLTLAGEISQVCKKKGCWMSLKNPNGEDVHVSYDYKFLLPLNVDGRNCIVKGNVYNDTTSVAYLKEIAKDLGKPQTEIDKITEPKIQKAILATTVWIK
jgi:hypothetical protein